MSAGWHRMIFVEGGFKFEVLTEQMEDVPGAIPLGWQAATFGRTVGGECRDDGPAPRRKGSDKLGEVCSSSGFLDEEVEQSPVVPEGIMAREKLCLEEVGLDPMDVFRAGAQSGPCSSEGCRRHIEDSNVLVALGSQVVNKSRVATADVNDRGGAGEVDSSYELGELRRWGWNQPS
jgi:hypothetical protein